MLKVVPIEVPIRLDEELFGQPGMTDGPGFSFYRIGKDGKRSYITTANEQALVAVTEKQFKSWKAAKIEAVPVLVELEE